MTENIRKVGYNDPKVINDGWILVFDLGKDYGKAEIKVMKKVGKERERKFNELVLPENEYPKVYYDILTVIKKNFAKYFQIKSESTAGVVGGGDGKARLGYGGVVFGACKIFR